MFYLKFPTSMSHQSLFMIRNLYCEGRRRNIFEEGEPHYDRDTWFLQYKAALGGRSQSTHVKRLDFLTVRYSFKAMRLPDACPKDGFPADLYDIRKATGLKNLFRILFKQN